MKKPRISSETCDKFLGSQGALDDAEDVAIKRVLAWQIADAMKSQGIAKTAMAARMQMDRRQLDRLLEPDTAPRRNGGGTQTAR